MDAFLSWFFEFMNFMLQGIIRFFVGIFEGIVQTFNIGRYIEIFRSHYQQFGFLIGIIKLLSQKRELFKESIICILFLLNSY